MRVLTSVLVCSRNLLLCGCKSWVVCSWVYLLSSFDVLVVPPALDQEEVDHILILFYLCFTPSSINAWCKWQLKFSQNCWSKMVKNWQCEDLLRANKLQFSFWDPNSPLWKSKRTVILDFLLTWIAGQQKNEEDDDGEKSRKAFWPQGEHSPVKGKVTWKVGPGQPSTAFMTNHHYCFFITQCVMLSL